VLRRWVCLVVALGLLAACSSASGSAAGSGTTTVSGTTGTTTTAGSPPAPAKTKAKIHVSPAAGGVHTTFVVTFKAPQAAGAAGIRSTSYEVSALGPQGSGCQFSIQRSIRKARKGEHERISLRPGGQDWCRGTFRGTVELISGPNCVKGQVCPEFVSVVSTVGRFRFLVK
jgi:hypothetical protein